MKVVLINGSPKAKGNTSFVLQHMADVFSNSQLEVEHIHVGKEIIRGCLGCGVCRKKQNRKCIIDNDIVNESLELLANADALVVATPVYFAGMSGPLKCFLDRTFYVSSSNGNLLRHKVAGAMAIMRRGGGDTAVDGILKYFQFAEMLTPGSIYWGIAFGAIPGEVLQDTEGMQTAAVLAENMVWLLQNKQQSNALIPEQKIKKSMNFIR